MPLISKTKIDSLPDHYYFSDQDDPLDYYDNVDVISIPSSSIKPLNNKKNYSSSSIQSSSSSLSQSTAPAQAYVRPEPMKQNRPQFKLPEFSESRYDQSTLKSYFMNSSPTTESISLANLRTTTTEKSTSTVRVQATTNARDLEVQRQKILSFIISDNQPSSFRAPSSTTQKPLALATNKNINANNNYFKAFVNTQESTTVSHPNTTSTNSPRIVYQSPTKTTLLLSRDQLAPNKTIRLTLSSSLDSSAVKSPQSSGKLYTQGFVEEIPLIKTRQPETRQSLYLKPIEPTTYSPLKPFRTSTETTTTNKPETTMSASTLSPFLIEDDPETFVTHSRRRPYVNDFLTNANNIPTRFPPRSTTTTEIPMDVSEITTQAPTSTTTFRSVIQSFTSRGLVFKENFNRTYEPQNLKPIVSPYISLETQRLTNAIRMTTPRPNEYSSSSKFTSTSTSLPQTPSSTYRSYFLITAPAKDKTSIPSTFLFPESSSPSFEQTTTDTAPSTVKPSPFVVASTESSFISTENSRGRYRPYVTFTSQNSIDEEATTYSPRLRYNTRTQTMVDSVSSSLPPVDQPAIRRKIVRLKSSLLPPNKPVDIYNLSAELRVDATTPTPLREVSDKFVASPSRESSQLKPLASKSNDFVSKLSYSSDSPSAALKLSSNSFSNLPKSGALRSAAAPVEITEKPFFYIRFKNASTNFEPLETSTKRFRATVEMPEMNVPTEKELNAFVVDKTQNEEVYDEEENNHQHSSDSLDTIEDDNNNNQGEHEVDYAYVDSTSTTTTVAPSTYSRIQFNTTYSTSTSTYQPTTSTLTSTSLRTTEKVPTPTTTANPKSLIPPRTSRVNNAIKTSIGAGLPRRNSASIKCNDISANAKCNEIPSRYYNRFSETKNNSLALDNKTNKLQAQLRFDLVFTFFF